MTDGRVLLKMTYRHLSLADKKRHFVKCMHYLDVKNNILISKIDELRQHGCKHKDLEFYQLIKALKVELKAGRALREGYRKKIRRIKETIKNKNRVLFNGGFNVR